MILFEYSLHQIRKYRISCNGFQFSIGSRARASAVAGRAWRASDFVEDGPAANHIPATVSAARRYTLLRQRLEDPQGMGESRGGPEEEEEAGTW